MCARSAASASHPRGAPFKNLTNRASSGHVRAAEVSGGDCVGYVGSLDGEPVATAAPVTAAGVVGVYNVATLPQHRRRGLGEAVMRYALERAREESGCERTILQATEHGLPLYLSMGYRTVTSVEVYALE